MILRSPRVDGGSTKNGTWLEPFGQHALPLQGGIVEFGTEVSPQTQSVLLEAIERTSDLVILYGADGVCEWVSPSVQRLLGFEPAELVGSRTSLIHPDDRDSAVLALQKAMDRHETTMRTRVRMVAADERVLWMDAGIELWWSAPGRLVRQVATMRDITEQVVAEQALRESESRYRMLAENSGDVVVSADATGLLQFVSPAVTALLGYAPADLAGTDLRELVHPDDVAMVAAAASAMREAPGRSSKVTARLRCADGSYWWVAVVGREVIDSSGAVCGSVATWRDAQGLVEAEHELKSARDRAEATLDSMLDAQVTLMAEPGEPGQRDWVFATINRAAAQRLGADGADLIGHSAIAVAPASAREPLREWCERIASGQPLVLDDTSIDSSFMGAERWFDLRGTQVGDELLSITWRDVTDRHQSVARLAASEQRYRLLAENSADVVLSWEYATRLVLYASPSARYALGWPPEVLTGTRISELLHPDDAPETLKFDAGSPASRARVRVRCRDGGYRWTEVLHRPVRDVSGDIVRVVSALRDIEDQVAAEQSLAESEHRYRRLLDNASDVVFESSAEGVLTWVSESVQRMLGFDAATMVGRRGSEFVHPDDVAHAQHLRGQLHAGQEVRARLRLVAADGRLVWADFAATLVRDRDTGTEIVVGSWRDVTVEQQQLQTIDEERSRLKATVDSEMDPRVTLEAVRDPDNSIVDYTYRDANDAAIAYLRVDAEQFNGAHMSEFYPAEETVALRALLAESITTATRIALDDFRYQGLFDNGDRYFDMRGTPIGDAVNLSWRDVTPRHDAVRELAVAKEEYRLLAENSSDVVCRVLLDGVIEWVSPAALPVLGWQPADLVGKRNVDLVHPDDRDAFVAEVQRLVASGTDGRFTARFQRGDGTGYEWIEAVSTQVDADEDHPAFRVVRWRDISAEVAAEQALAASEEHFRMLAEQVSDVVVSGDNEGIMRWVSPSVSSATGWEPRELVGQPFVTLVHPDDVITIRQVQAEVEKGRARAVQVRLRDRRGAYRWYDIAVDPIRGDDGQVTGRIARWRDIDKQVTAERALATSEYRYRSLVQRLSDVLVSLSPEGAIMFVSAAITDLLGWTPEELVGTPVQSLLEPDLPATSLAAEDLPARARARLACRDGSRRWIEATITRQYDADGTLTGVLSMWRDAEDLVRREARALAEADDLYTITDNLAAVVFRLEDGVVTWVSPSVTNELGGTEDWWIGSRLADRVHPDDFDAFSEARARTLAGEPTALRLRMRDFSGAYRWVDASGRAVEGGAVVTVTVVDQDVAREDYLRLLAESDSLTGLATRRTLEQRLTEIQSDRREVASHPALLFCDIDNLKPTNDTYGHSAGDFVLITLADRIQRTIRNEDVAARVGGDEMVVILAHVADVSTAARIAENLRSACAEPITLPDGRSITMTLSIGVVMAGRDEEAAQVIARADRAMYTAKRAGGNSVAVAE